jgi:hypothetical protein
MRRIVRASLTLFKRTHDRYGATFSPDRHRIAGVPPAAEDERRPSKTMPAGRASTDIGCGGRLGIANQASPFAPGFGPPCALSVKRTAASFHAAFDAVEGTRCRGANASGRLVCVMDSIAIPAPIECGTMAPRCTAFETQRIGTERGLRVCRPATTCFESSPAGAGPGVTNSTTSPSSG